MKSLLQVFVCGVLVITTNFVFHVTARNAIPSICLQPPPRSEGVCTVEIEGFYFDTRINDCQMYVVGGCRSYPGQSFGSIDDCRATCIHGTRRIQDLQPYE